MYLPAAFASENLDHALRLMRDYPFATLTSMGEDGFPFASQLPLHVQATEGGGFTLLGHLAKANPHCKLLQAQPQALVCFQGPHAYMSPSVYPDARRVPTWSYLALHCQVKVQWIEGVANTDRLLKALIGDHEPAYAAQWRAQDAQWAHAMLQGVRAMELQVVGWQCKLKLNQHRPESHAAMHSAYAQGTPDEQALAQWMQDLGMVPPVQPAAGSVL